MSRQRKLAIFWASHIPIGILAYLLLPRDVFIAASLLYTVIASQWANVASHWAADFAEQAAQETNSDDSIPSGQEAAARPSIEGLPCWHCGRPPERNPHSPTSP